MERSSSSVSGSGAGRRIRKARTPAWIHARSSGHDDDRLLQPGGQARAQRLGSEGREEAGEDPDEEAQAHLLQAAGVEGGDRGEPAGPAVRLVEDEPAAVGGADEVDPVEAEGVEGLVQPLGGALGLPHGFAVDAAAGVAGGVERVDGAFGAERGGVRVPHGGAAARAVDQDDRRAGLGRGVRGAVPVDVRGAEARLHVRLRSGPVRPSRRARRRRRSSGRARLSFT